MIFFIQSLLLFAFDVVSSAFHYVNITNQTGSLFTTIDTNSAYRHPGAKSVITNALSSNTWSSTVRVVYDPNSPFGRDIPVLCEFTNVYIDMARIFFVVNKLEYARTAALDLFDCCINFPFINYYFSINEKNCRNSVTADFCRCFHRGKFVPAIATEQLLQHKKPSANKSHDNGKNGSDNELNFLSGVTWVMHHWTEQHHIDHFGMKILELHGLLFNNRQAQVTSSQSQSFWFDELPSASSIDNLLSMDYPLDHHTSYEKMLLAILHMELSNPKLHYYSCHVENWRNFFLNTKFKLLNFRQIESICCTLSLDLDSTASTDDQRHKLNNMLNKQFNKLAKLIKKPQKDNQDMFEFPISKQTLNEICRKHKDISSTLSFPKTFHIENAYFSPLRKNNIPFPFSQSRRGLDASFQKYLKLHDREVQQLDLCPCVTKEKPARHIRVAVMQRSEGRGLRHFINFSDILRILNNITQENRIEVVYIDSKTPPIMQASIFCSFHLIVSPHSSQLSNLIFAQDDVSIIEIQNYRVYPESTFFNLGNKLNLHYQLLLEGNIPYNPDTKSPYGIAAGDKTTLVADTFVNLQKFEIAVQKSVRHLEASGYLVNK